MSILRGVGRGWRVWPRAAAILLAAGGVIGPSWGREPGEEARAYFETASAVSDLRLVIAPEDVEKLRADARVYVPFVLFENGREAARGGVKLKGAAGSFREFDDRPAFTLKLDKFGGKATFHGLEKLHLNNSVQDESLLCEWLCSEIFRGAGCPAPRVSHARVTVNDRDLGFYVLKEGFDRAFIARNFARKTGNLYDGGFCQDIDAELELDLPGGDKERADLKRLVAACQEEDLEKRWAAIEKELEVPAFIRFMALELMVGHWDGYCGNVNNYRVYFESGAGGKAQFLPHGMDQVFQDPGFPVLDPPRGMVAAAVMQRKQWRAAYRDELGGLMPLFDASKLAAKAEAVQKRLQPAIRAVSPEAAEQQAQRVKELLERITEREKSLNEQLARRDPEPLSFTPGAPVRIDGLQPVKETEDAEVEPAEEDGASWLRVKAGPGGRCVASWRRELTLPRGRYRLEAVVKCEGVEAIADEAAPGVGAGVRISGSSRAQTPGLIGNESRSSAFEFEVGEEAASVTLVLELRAAKGAAWFRADSVTLTLLGAEK